MMQSIEQLACWSCCALMHMRMHDGQVMSIFGGGLTIQVTGHAGAECGFLHCCFLVFVHRGRWLLHVRHSSS